MMKEYFMAYELADMRYLPWATVEMNWSNEFFASRIVNIVVTDCMQVYIITEQTGSYPYMINQWFNKFLKERNY